jgi:hypothetical protein
VTSVVHKLKRKKPREPAEERIPDENQLEMFEIEALRKASRQKETFLSATNAVTIREMPYQPLRTFRLDRSAIKIAKRGE